MVRERDQYEVTAARRAQLGRFLRTHRARLRPEDVGLPSAGDPARRRTPGLRREEVAELSGVGLTWYTWLEQGRAEATASSQVIDALARALRLDPDEHSHLRHLAGLTEPARHETVADLARLQHLVDAAMPSVASVYDRYYDYLVWNAAYRRVRLDPGALPEHRRNLVWMMFTDVANRARMPRWEQAARAVLGQLRDAAGRHPGDRRFAALVDELKAASPEFRQWWSEYPVRVFRPATIGVQHQRVGALDLVMYQLRPVENPDLILVMQVPATPADAKRIRALLGVDGPGAGQHRRRAE